MMTTNPVDGNCPEQIRRWLTAAVDAEASDLHLVSGYPPVLRVHGDLQQLEPSPLAADGPPRAARAALPRSRDGAISSRSER